MNDEVWRELPFAPKYQISNYCRVNGTNKRNNKQDKISSGTLNAKGYRYYVFYFNGKSKSLRLHRLAFCVFNGEDYWDETFEVDHINRQRDSNHLSNLRKVTHRENSNNRSKYITNTSGHTGLVVRRHVPDYPFRAETHVRDIDGKKFCIGSWGTSDYEYAKNLADIIRWVVHDKIFAPFYLEPYLSKTSIKNLRCLFSKEYQTA